MSRIYLFFVIVLMYSCTDSNCQKYDISYIEKCLIKIQVNKTGILSVDTTGLIAEDYSLGTGIYISSDGLIITAAHVIEKRNRNLAGTISCKDNISKENFVPIVIYEDSKNDIAILQNVKYTNYGSKNDYFIDINNIDKQLLIKNNDVIAFGYPNELHGYDKIGSFSVGKIISPNTNLEGYEKIKSRSNVSLADCVVLSGCSGGIITSNSFLPIGIILGSVIDKNKRVTYFKSFGLVKKILSENGIEL